MSNMGGILLLVGSGGVSFFLDDQARRKQNGFGQANGVGAMFARGVWGHAPPGKCCILGLLRLLLVQLFGGKLAKFEWIAYCQKNETYS